MITSEMINDLINLLQECGYTATDVGRDHLSNRCGRMITALQLHHPKVVPIRKGKIPPVVYPPCDTEPA